MAESISELRKSLPVLRDELAEVQRRRRRRRRRRRGLMMREGRQPLESDATNTTNNQLWRMN
jgi:hypothetical protein